MPVDIFCAETSLLYVATHEIGHSLGLGHSHSRDAVMFGTYLEHDGDLKLDIDDIAGITFLYGESSAETRGWLLSGCA